MDAVLVTNPELRAQKLQDIKDKLDANRAEIDAASTKILNDEDLTLREESLYFSYSWLMTNSLTLIILR